MGKYSWSDKQNERRQARRPAPGLPKESAKEKVRKKEYALVRIEKLLENPVCELQIECRGNRATEVHHPAGRIGPLLTDKRNMKSSCAPCHRFAEDHPEQAKAMGASKSRLNKP